MTSFRSSTKNNHSKEDVPSNWYRLGLLSKKNKNRESTNFAVGSTSGTPTFNVDNNYSRDNTKSLRSRFGGLRGSNENNNFGDSYDYRSRAATPNSNIAPSFHSRSTGDRDLQTGSVTPRPFSNSDSRAPSSMTGMLDMDRARSRRDRTFVGSQCAVCDEPLEHTLRGERIIQFSCGHVSHEACFYEYIKEFDSQVCPECNAPLSLDTSRGGNVLDLEKISNIVRSVSVADSRSETPRQQDYQRGREEIHHQGNNHQHQSHQSHQSHQPHPNHQSVQSHQSLQSHQSHQSLQSQQSHHHHHQHHGGYQDNNGGWETATQNSTDRPRHGSRTSSLTRENTRGGGDPRDQRDRRDQRDGRAEYLSARGDSVRESSASRQESHHWRNNSGASASDFAEPNVPGPARRHDYDVQSMESDLSPRNSVASSLPPPNVAIKSEFPTLTRSKQQQTLTCLVTVEVPERKWSVLGPEPTEPLPPLPTERPQMPANLPVPYDGYPNDPPSPSGRSHHSYEKQDPQMSREVLDAITEDLRVRVENWHGLDFARFGKLRLHGTIKVGKDCQSWQELECYLFSEMLICVKEKKISPNSQHYQAGARKKMKCTLKGSILIKKHLKKVNDLSNGNEHILTLSLSVTELPQFHLLFPNYPQLQQWQRALLDLHNVEVSPARRPTHDERANPTSDGDEDDYNGKTTRRVSSINSSFGPRSAVTAPTEYSNSMRHIRIPAPVHSPLDIVVVIPVSSSMQGLKINLLRDSLKFLVQNLGEKDRMGLVTFGSSGGGVPMVQMTSKNWNGWPKVIHSIRPVGPKVLRADVVEGANVAMDLLMQRKSRNPIASILLISDSSTSETDTVDFVVSRAEAAKISIHSFGLGLTHKPDNLIELSTRTKATYTYVKDWMMLRECVAGCVGSLQSLSHQNVKLKLKLPEGSPARFSKISGALHISKRASGREAEASLGDLRFGDKKDILVQLVISPDTTQPDDAPHDAWESIVSGLEALGGSMEQEDSRSLSIEEVPLIQADLTFGDIQREGSVTQLSRPHLLAITMLPPTQKKIKDSGRSPSTIPPHPMIVQRRMELLTSDMLTRALTLVSRGQHDPAQTLLQETKTILRGLGKGGLPPIPSAANERSNPPSASGSENGAQNSTPPLERDFTPAAGIDPNTVSALLAELEAALEWIGHPAVFQRDSRKAVLQAIGVISSQRGNTFRTPCESYWANRISGIKRLLHAAREWRDPEEALAEKEEDSA